MLVEGAVGGSGHGGWGVRDCAQDGDRGGELVVSREVKGVNEVMYGLGTCKNIRQRITEYCADAGAADMLPAMPSRLLHGSKGEAHETDDVKFQTMDLGDGYGRKPTRFQSVVLLFLGHDGKILSV